MERLQKVLAGAGLASRRGAERLIDEGRVTVNGALVVEKGVRVDPGRDAIKVDGKRVVLRARTPTYLMLHKPRGYVTTLSDPEGRPTVGDLLERVPARVFPVGRLDFASEGLLLLTDDGELAAGLTHPRREVERTYAVRVRGLPDREALERLERGGIPVAGRPVGEAKVRVVRRGSSSWLELSITEGRKHHVRKMLEAVGHPVQRLRRVGYGGVALGRLEPGRWRRLTPTEIARLKRAAGLDRPRRSGARQST